MHSVDFHKHNRYYFKMYLLGPVSTVSVSASHSISALAYLCTYFTWHLLYLYAPHTHTYSSSPLRVHHPPPSTKPFSCVSSSVCQLSLHLFKCASWFSISRNKWPKSAAAQVPILHLHTEKKKLKKLAIYKTHQ